MNLSKLLELINDRTDRLDPTRAYTLFTIVIGGLLTAYSVIKQDPNAIYYFSIFMGLGGGLTVSKGVVDTKQKQIKEAE